MNIKISFAKYFIALASSIIILFLVQTITFNSGDVSVLGTFIQSVFCYFITLLFYLQIVVKSDNSKLFVIFVFFLKIILGTIHYIGLIDPLYFSSSGNLIETGTESDRVFEACANLVHEKHLHGFFYYNPTDYPVTHPEIWNIISMLLYHTCPYALNYCPMNAFFSSLFAIGLVIITNCMNYKNTRILNFVKYLAFFFPFFILSDSCKRDQFGLSLMMISMTLYVLSLKDKMIYQLAAILIVLFSSYLLRTVYPLLFLIALILGYINRFKNKNFSLLFIIVVLIVFLPIMYHIVLYEQSMYHYLEGNKILSSTGVATLPIRIIIGLIGPFPWTQLFQNWNWLSRIFLGTLHISMFYLVVKNRQRMFRLENLSVMEFFGFFLMMAGIFTSMMEITYVTVGVVFLIPWFCSLNNSQQLSRAYLFFFICLFIVSTVSSLSGSFGITKIWK